VRFRSRETYTAPSRDSHTVPPVRRPRPPAAVTLAALAALALAGCGRSGYGTVDTHQLVLIPTARPASAMAQRADAQLICGARAEAAALHRAFAVQRPRTGSASAQIAVANAVTADKPGGVLIVPVAPNPMLAPILSMRRAGIKVVRLTAPRDPTTSATAGARAVSAAVRAIGGRRTVSSQGDSLPDRCKSVQ
jgi:ABC-type sugar transport system substrate-binding protein